MRSLAPQERRDWLRLSRSENVGQATFYALIERFGSAGAAIDALPRLSARGGLRRPIRIYPRDDAERDLDRAAALGARWAALGEAAYPALLGHVPAPPPLVCLRGKASVAARPTVAVVGARNASALGRKFARQAAAELGASGFTVVSGFARGIDTAAHEASLDTGTVAVLAGGIDVIYPPENAVLHRAIAEQGLLMCEMAPGTQPLAKHFPRRNRLISGMSLGVLVVEAAERSGSLITARFALEQGREVFAVPGSPLDPRAAGANGLIRQGASLATSAGDVIEALRPLLARPPASATGASEPEAGEGSGERGIALDTPADVPARILELLGPAPTGIDDLIRESRCDPASVYLVLLELDLAGRISRGAGRTVLLLDGA